jgi:hypothetical protein
LLLIGTVPSVIIPRGAEDLGYGDNDETAAQFRATRIARRLGVVNGEAGGGATKT